MPISQHVPELPKEIPIEEQAERLTKMLRGHKLFAEVRGTMSGLGNVTKHFKLKHDISPTQALKDFDKTVGALRVFVNMLAQLNRDKCYTAASELRNALTLSEYRVWCEEEPFESSRPCVLVVFQPDIMFKIIDWHLNENGLYEVDRLFDPALEDRIHSCFSRKPHTEEIAALLPSMEDVYNSPASALYNAELFIAIRRDVVDPILQNVSGEASFDPRGLRTRFVALYAGERVSSLSLSPTYARDTYEGGAFAYLVEDADQKEVLSWFPRGKQKLLATWQLHINKAHFLGIPNHRIALFPESEHSTWGKVRPSLVSRGVSFGKGAIYAPQHEFSVEEDSHIYLTQG